MSSMTVAVLEPVRTTFRAVATTVVPETASLPPGGWSALEAMVEQALSARPEPLQRQLVAFLRVIEFLPVVWHRRRFTRLAPVQQADVLRRLERSPLLLVRRGFWGLRTLVMMGYYTQPEVQSRIGYRAHPDGWSARRRSGEHAAAGQAPITLDVPALPDEALRAGRSATPDGGR
jgi:hypothetical protein